MRHCKLSLYLFQRHEEKCYFAVKLYRCFCSSLNRFRVAPTHIQTHTHTTLWETKRGSLTVSHFTSSSRSSTAKKPTAQKTRTCSGFVSELVLFLPQFQRNLLKERTEVLKIKNKTSFISNRRYIFFFM